MANGFKVFRERVGIKTQTALAEMLEINPANVCAWEAGKGFPSYQQIKKLFELGATVEELFGIDYKVSALGKGLDLAALSDAEAAAIVRQGLRAAVGAAV